jgi:hypothetical protein
MSTKTLRKRIALVAVSALGFGLFSAAPSFAGAAAVTELTISKAASASDASLFIATSGGAALTRTYKIFTANSTVATSDIAAAITSAGDTTTGFRKLTLAAGTLTTLRATAATAFTVTAALTSATATAIVDATGTSPLLTLPATTAGSSYVLFNDGIIAADGLAGTLDQKPTANEALVEITIYRTTSTTSITPAATSAAAVVGLNGQAGAYTITYASPASTDVVNPSMRISSAPAGSKLLTNPLNHRISSTNAQTALSASAMFNGSAWFDGMSSATAESFNSAVAQQFNGAVAGVDKNFYFWPDVAGTYSFVFFDDRNNNKLVDGNDVSTTYTIVVGGAASTIAVSNLTGLSATNATTPGATTFGAVIRVSSADSGARGTAPAADGGVTVTISGSGKATYKNGSAIAATSSLTLGTADFDGSGYAYLNVSNTVAETVTVSIAGTGSLATATGSATTAQFVAASAGIQVVPGSAGTAGTSGTGFIATNATTYVIPAASTISWESVQVLSISTTATPKYAALQVIDTQKGILGSSIALTYVRAAQTDATLGYADFSIKTAATTVGAAYQVIGNVAAGTAAATVTASIAVPAITSTTVAFTPASGVRLAPLGSVAIVATVKNQFGAVVPNASVTWSVTGRNTSTVNQVVVTNSLGQASFTLTDAAASTSTAITDVITASVSYTEPTTAAVTTTSGTYTVNYSTVAISTVKMTTDNTTAGVANLGTPVSAGLIQAGLAGPSGTTARKALTATVTDANGAVAAGVACVWTVAGTGAAIPSTAVTSYTSALGVCTSSVYAWIAGTYTVTVTAGGIAGTGTQTFHNATASSVRTISATVNGNVVTAVVKDRFGNGVAGATVYAVATGGANIGGLLIATTPTAGTDLTGSVSWVVTGSGSIKVSTINPSGTGLAPDQSTAAAGNHLGDVATPVVFTATTVGTTTTAETGVGATFSAAGVSSATVAVVADTSTADAATAAADAAAEATDAANAATDAANAAAEAADAATAAAQDAADAVAALSTQVSEMVNALKKQITALTNLVIKIQKKVKA